MGPQKVLVFDDHQRCRGARDNGGTGTDTVRLPDLSGRVGHVTEGDLSQGLRDGAGYDSSTGRCDGTRRNRDGYGRLGRTGRTKQPHSLKTFVLDVVRSSENVGVLSRVSSSN